ncbi:MAG: tetratricopeptide repeat protein [Cyanobacteria bacterium REEB67]|nr:tetratricopeptide repeat protein [Cyanobacteria bacterium REEB67]
MQLFKTLTLTIALTLSPTIALAQEAGCQSCLKTASGLFSRGDNAGAAKVLNEWQAKCPQNLQLLLMLNTVLSRMPGEKARALEAAEKACILAPNNMLAHFQKAMTLMVMQQGPAAAKEFQRVVDLDPTSYEAWSALSELLGAQGDSQGAKAAADKALQLSPSARQSQLNAINSKNRMGNVQGVKQEISKISDDPNTARENLLIVGEEAFRLGYFEEAAACIAQVQNKYPDAPQVRITLPLALIESGKAVTMGPDSKTTSTRSKGNTGNSGTTGSADYEALLGLNAVSNGDLEGGEKIIEKAAAADPGDSIVLLASGQLAYRLGHYRAALEKFNDALSKNKSLSLARLFVAQTSLAQGDWKEAISQARECQAKASGFKVSADAIELIARIRDSEDNGNNVPNLKAELQNLGPKTCDTSQADAENALGELALKDKDPGRARQLFSAAKDHYPGGFAGRIGLGRVALSEGDYETANKELDQAIARAPGSIEALSLKAVALAATNDAGGAFALLNKIDQEGELPAATCIDLGKAFQKVNQNKLAATYYKKALQAGLTGNTLQQTKDALKAVGP